MSGDIPVVGQVIGGGFGEIIARQKSGTDMEIGDLLVSDEAGAYTILQVVALEYGSQIQDRIQQMMSGMKLEETTDAKFYEPGVINYVLARIKPLVRLQGNKIRIPKSLPPFFNRLRHITEKDLEFLKMNKGQIFVGHIRSGSKVLRDAEVWLDAKKVLSHHVLIPATTGRGKSNLVKTILWHILESEAAGVLVLDAHDEYYGRHGKGLRDHAKSSQRLVYYTPSDDVPPGANMLSINIRTVRPEHFEGIIGFSDAQLQVIHTYHANHDDEWIEHIMNPARDNPDNSRATMSVLRRKIGFVLGLRYTEEGLDSRYRVFEAGEGGSTTVKDIADHIEAGKVAVLDTSQLSGEAELIIGNMVASKILSRYKQYKQRGELDSKPVVSIVIEEAPRVIGEDALASGGNIYSTIAKEGRKFKIGLLAITQLASVIPRTILANMNTKIILGNELKQERDAIIASASQDLTSDDRNISSLNLGEAIVTSIFVPFAMPISIPDFEEVARKKSADNDRIKVH